MCLKLPKTSVLFTFEIKSYDITDQGQKNRDYLGQKSRQTKQNRGEFAAKDNVFAKLS